MSGSKKIKPAFPKLPKEPESPEILTPKLENIKTVWDDIIPLFKRLSQKQKRRKRIKNHTEIY